MRHGKRTAHTKCFVNNPILSLSSRCVDNIDELKKAKPEQSVDLIEFEANVGFVEGRKRYRLKPIEDLYLVARYKAQFRSFQLEEVDFVARNEVTLTPEGEKWMSKKINARVQLGTVKLQKERIT